MNVLSKKAGHGGKIMPIESLLLQERKIILSGRIDNECISVFVNEFISEIIHLNAEDSEQPIDVVFSSLQMNWNAGLILCDVLQSKGAPIRMYCIGQLEGIAAILFAGGQHGRYMTPHARLHIRFSELASFRNVGFASESSNMRQKAEPADAVTSLIEEYVEINTKGLNFSDGKEFCFDAKSCREYGLCDEIVPFDILMEPTAEISEDQGDDGYQEEADEFDTDFWNCV